jgi:hypothetical protein
MPTVYIISVLLEEFVNCWRWLSVCYVWS